MPAPTVTTCFQCHKKVSTAPSLRYCPHCKVEYPVRERCSECGEFIPIIFKSDGQVFHKNCPKRRARQEQDFEECSACKSLIKLSDFIEDATTSWKTACPECGHPIDLPKCFACGGRVNRKSSYRPDSDHPTVYHKDCYETNHPGEIREKEERQARYIERNGQRAERRKVLKALYYMLSLTCAIAPGAWGFKHFQILGLLVCGGLGCVFAFLFFAKASEA